MAALVVFLVFCCRFLEPGEDMIKELISMSPKSLCVCVCVGGGVGGGCGCVCMCMSVCV